MSMPTAWLVEFDSGPTAYAEVWALQRELVRARQNGLVPDLLLLLEHRPVVTLGRSSEDAHLLLPRQALRARGIDVFEIERGGSATYHGPGQLVGYPILDLRRLGEDVGRFMRTLEQTVIDTLAAFDIAAGRKSGYPGVWVGDAKICAMGVAIKRRVTMHGFALNVATDLAAFSVINPCGLGRPVTSMAQVLGRDVRVADVRPVYAGRFAAAFGVELVARRPDDLRAALSAAV